MEMLGADNHGRLRKKPQAKEAARNSYNYLVYEIAATALQNYKNIRTRLHLPLKAQFDIERRSVLAEHGNNTRAWMGIPHYGIERAEGREARKRLKRGRPFTLHLCGHWHVGAHIGDLIINGSLCGSTEYDAGAGRFAVPSQTSFLMHRRHGPFSRISWDLTGEDRDNGEKKR